MPAESSERTVPPPVRAIRVLQVGDVHYPGWKELRPPVDNKDLGISGDLARSVGTHPVQLILRDLAVRLHKRRYDAVVLMGDLTTKGSFAEFEKALGHLSPLFNLKRLNAAGQRAFYVPGNHDVNRDVAIRDGMEAKFDGLNDAGAKRGWPRFPVRGVNQVDINPSAALLLMNSCLGCGEPRMIPASVRNAISAALDTALKSSDPKIALEEYYEQLDTPALHDDALTELAARLKALSPKCLPIIVAHHNVLPQREPRLAPYTELINAGRLRDVITGSNRSVLYLHGHIHDDPVEIVTDPTRRQAKLISIAAPELQEGFNEVVVYLDRDNTPCGCQVMPVRLKGASGIVEGAPIDISLTDQTRSMKSRWGYDILQIINRDKKVFWHDLAEELETQNRPRPFHETDVAAAVVSLHFAGFIRVEPIESPYVEWRIESW